MYKNFIKIGLDFLVAFIGIIVLSPVFLTVMVMLLINNEGKAFFFQARPGKKEKIFNIVKFKTMTDKKDNHGNLLSDAKRLTPIGRLIRKTSLDEIPQLINVLKGDMSIVGPRPLLPEYLPLYNDNQKRRHNVKPGITGYAQVNGRNAISWQKKFQLDVWYVNNISFFLDIKILIQTVLKVIKKEDINAIGQVTTEPFNGKN